MADVKNILVVDDEAMIREAVASYLEAQGYGVYRQKRAVRHWNS